MQITATTTFRDGADTFEQGVTYHDIDPRRGGRFVSHRWATSPEVDQSWLGGAGATATTLPGPVVLEPADVVHRHAAEVL